ncbi:hypothetical protein I5M27_12795 [Adhaeribacter sp. BT258]|uniref:DUF3999 domain-containing protein n=1 Tax=Adhaeribacter terrigena TaxID=2793070 RepID=A0ABS1C388_9BACT|nr:hypothetical protein [Adhaeribacter terrigena]MBK0403870.1 hypothetical protein [Adhaeribacter terrigena]
MKKAVAIFWILLTLKTLGFGQQKLFKAPLPAVSENGFYKINLRPEIISYTNADFSDLRILDDKNRELPYLLERTATEKTTRYFREYPVISKNSVPKVNTTLIIQNPRKSKINNLGLVIKNTNVSKIASLSGSSDSQNWFALEDDYVLQSVTNTEETSEVKVLHFPLSDYEFYKLEINDSASAPLNILAAGFYDFNAEKGQYQIIPDLTFDRTDSTQVKKTFLWFSSERPVLIDKLEFEIDSTTFYLRNATVFVKETVYSRRNKKQETWVPVHHFQLRSDAANSFQISGFRAKEFYVEIENADNPPLEILAVKAYQLKTSLIAELKKNRRYELHFGNEKAVAPAYDLPFFKDKLPENLPVLEPLTVNKNAMPEAGKSAVNRFFQDKSLIWIALLLVIAFLGYMTYQMLKEASPPR